MNRRTRFITRLGATAAAVGLFITAVVPTAQAKETWTFGGKTCQYSVMSISTTTGYTEHHHYNGATHRFNTFPDKPGSAFYSEYPSRLHKITSAFIQANGQIVEGYTTCDR